MSVIFTALIIIAVLIAFFAFLCIYYDGEVKFDWFITILILNLLFGCLLAVYEWLSIEVVWIRWFVAAWALLSSIFLDYALWDSSKCVDVEGIRAQVRNRRIAIINTIVLLVVITLL